MIAVMKKRLGGASRREKTLMAVTAFITLTYIIYATFFESQFAEIRLAQKTLAGLDSAGQNMEKIRGGMKKKSVELERIRKRLGKLEQKEKTLSANLTARGYMGGVLKSMEDAARNMPIQLLQLDSTIGVVSKQTEYPLSNANGSPRKDGETAGRVNVSFIKNVIKLKYRSQYPDGVDYFAKLLELPYAVSILSFEALNSSGAKRTASAPITYSMEIEVFSK